MSLLMNEKPYVAAPYRMRNESAFMVCADGSGRVVVLGLSEARAAILAALLNVAALAANPVDYEEGRARSRAARPRTGATRRSDVDRPLPDAKA
jgi:hypothetical protein